MVERVMRFCDNCGESVGVYGSDQYYAGVPAGAEHTAHEHGDPRDPVDVCVDCVPMASIGGTGGHCDRENCTNSDPGVRFNPANRGGIPFRLCLDHSGWSLSGNSRPAPSGEQEPWG